MKTIAVVLILILIPAGGARGGSSTTGEALEIGVGRQTALGDAGQAGIETPAALHYNPAGLARVRPGYYQFSYQSQIEQVGMGNVDIGSKWGGTYLGVGMRYLSYGDEERLVYDEEAGLEGKLVEEGEFSSSDVVLSGGIARRYGGLTYGMVLKMLRMQIDEEQAQGIGMDLGLQYQMGSKQLPVSAGVVIRNMGSGIKFVEESSPLPMLVRVGLSGNINPKAKYLSFGFHGDIENRLQEGRMDYLLGLEWELLNRFTIMGGYDGRNDAGDKLTLGLGMILLEEWNLPDYYMGLDYSMASRGELGTVHQFTISVYPQQNN